MVLPRSLSLPVDVLARLVEWENLELHRVLSPTPVWRPRAVEAAAEEVAREHVAGLLDRHGRLDVEVAASLAVVCRPRVEFYGWMHDGTRTIGVLAGAIGREAVLAIRDGDEVWLSQGRSSKLADALIAQTSAVPAGRGEPVSALRSEVLAGASGHEAVSRVGTRPAGPQVRLIHRIAALPTTGCGELHVAIRDDMGRRRQSPRPLRYADTVHGRWLNHAVPVAGGHDDQILVAPAGRPELVARLLAAHRSLT